MEWGKTVGGLKAHDQARADANTRRCLSDWVAQNADWVERSSPANPAERSNTSVCLKVIKDPAVTKLSPMTLRRQIRQGRSSPALDKAGVAYDIDAAIATAPTGLRIWCRLDGGKFADLAALTPWLDFAFAAEKAALKAAA